MDQDESIKMFAHTIEQLEAKLASDPRGFFIEFADKDPTRKGSRSDPLDRNELFALSMQLTLMEIADMLAAMTRLPPDHEYYHKPIVAAIRQPDSRYYQKVQAGKVDIKKAVRQGKADDVKLVLDMYPDRVHARDTVTVPSAPLAAVDNVLLDGQSMWTPLHYATGGNQCKVAEILISLGADLNAINNVRQSLLRYSLLLMV